MAEEAATGVVAAATRVMAAASIALGRPGRFGGVV
jgi:hypothetical protein